MINAVFFDVDDTIYDQQKPFRRSVEQVFPYFEQKDIGLAYKQFRHYSDTGFPKVASGEWEIDFFRYFRLNETLKDLGYKAIPVKIAKQFQEVYEHELENIEMLEEMRVTLTFLKNKKIPIGIITNGPAEHQLKKVENLGLYEFVESKNVIVAGATDFQKPQKEIFDLAADRFGIKPENTLYVGDSYENDVVGSHNGVWKSLWFNHRKRKIPSGETPLFDYEVESFSQLIFVVEKLVTSKRTFDY